jgi:hypothetical protein
MTKLRSGLALSIAIVLGASAAHAIRARQPAPSPPLAPKPAVPAAPTAATKPPPPPKVPPKPPAPKAPLGGANLAVVTVTNPSAFARAKETIALSGAELVKQAPGFELKKALVVDAAGRPVLSQLVDMNGDAEPDELVFQADLAPNEAKQFSLRAGERHHAAAADYKTYGRFVRERHDDFVWENDLVAHRMYGPALESVVKEPLVSSGIDTWSKRSTKLLVNEWYMTEDYHQDRGDGADFYGVGKSRGCGGLGIWAGGKLYTSRNFTRSRVLANGPIRLVFELSYAAWELPGGAQVSETKRVILDGGTPFNKFESTFSGSKTPLSVGIGIAKHAGGTVQIDVSSGTMRAWEPVKDSKATPNGNLGCAIVLAPGAKLEAQNGELDHLAITQTDASNRVAYSVGSAWDRAGRVRDAEAWSKTVESAAAKLAAPLKVVVAPAATK